MASHVDPQAALLGKSFLTPLESTRKWQDAHVLSLQMKLKLLPTLENSHAAIPLA
jgi:hypothetical protein